MKHYHGTPLGGKRDEIARFAVNRHFLVPFNRPEDLPIVAEVASSFVFDNSAFTAWKSGKPITIWDDYYNWCREWCKHPSFDWALIPDVIDGNEQDNDDLIADWDKRMWHPIRVLGVPVWHFHESLTRLRRLMAGRWPIVALGSSGDWPTPGTQGWWGRMREIMQVACDPEGRPHCKLHGLRMLSPDIFPKIPLASADSTNVAQNSNLLDRFGMYKPPTQSQRCAVIASRIEAFSSSPRWLGARETQLMMYAGTEIEV